MPIQKLLNFAGLEELSVQWALARICATEHQDVLNRVCSIGQIESKLWLLDVLQDVLPRRSYNICLIGGWVGTLARLLYWRAPHLVRRIVLVDSDPEALAIAKRLQADLITEKKLELVCEDANHFDYGYDFHLIINSSCEHFTSSAWFERIPRGRLVALQSTDIQEPDHHRLIQNAYELRLQHPIEMALYNGELDLERGKRFMLIGRK